MSDESYYYNNSTKGAAKLCAASNQVELVATRLEIDAEKKLPMPQNPEKPSQLPEGNNAGYDVVCAALAVRVLVKPPEHYRVGDRSGLKLTG